MSCYLKGERRGVSCARWKLSFQFGCMNLKRASFNAQQQHISGMRERKGWTAAEDQVLRLLREERGQIKWSSIARTMQLQFGIIGKTGKQCRQRYHNHLKPTISHADWRPQEDALLLALHRQCGNRWSAIAQNIPGRTENCVKNHFYSKLRKVVRRLSRVAAESSETNPSPPSLSLLSRIVAASQCRFRPGGRVSEQWVSFAADLVEKLYNFQSGSQQRHRGGKQVELQILTDMAYFDLNFKKRKGSKRDISEGDYRQRRVTNSKKKQKNDLIISEHDAPLHTSSNQLKVQNYNISQIFPSKTSSLVTDYAVIQDNPSTDGVMSGMTGESEWQALAWGPRMLKGISSTVMSFCELQSWQRVGMLQQSEEYAYHYNPLEQ